MRRRRIIAEIIVVLAVILGIFSIGMLVTYKPVKILNPSERLWVEAADEIWKGKGLLEQTTSELQITSTALQVQISKGVFREAVNTFLIPVWAFVSLIGTAVVDYVVFRRPKP